MASRHGVTYPPGLTCYPSARSVHLDLESNKQTVLSGPLDPGIINVPVDAQFKLQSWVVHFAGGYNLLQSDTNSTLDVIFGTRLLDLDMDIKVDYEVLGEPRSRELSQSGNTWDAIVGLKGNIALGKRLYVPYQADIGTGESDFTWQALAGVSFRATLARSRGDLSPHRVGLRLRLRHR